ncbi:immunity protein Imm1 of predicted polymorphic toxin system [Motilibacter rhizosphaerae]|uniref:Immunity protein Imm1 of predicted polymorphic toxin system n=1 Tax=Motilibacter rhizosphaerae TaxID=598652 RepID=A0A4V2F570_9ACTN|nr:Imm1 family immunity protein [Motilibacter rhizosphaerae]RZS91789.1 immunity protein Imm1 of predicted polymorphic toxin system [Motilibacter rhizosphaerae]
MFVRTVASVSPWMGAVELAWEPDWDEATVRQLVDELDGVERTTLVLTGPDDAHLAVGGSAAAGLVVYVDYDGDVFVLAAGPDSDELLPLVVGEGQVQEYPLRYVVAPDVAVRAAWHFALTGDLDDAVEWHTQG